MMRPSASTRSPSGWWTGGCRSGWHEERQRGVVPPSAPPAAVQIRGGVAHGLDPCADTRHAEGGAVDHDDEALPLDPDLAPDDPGQPHGAATASAPREGGRRGSGRVQPGVLAVISLGGMLGASARYGVAQWIPTPHDRFPWATFWTNVSGSFLLGLFLVWILERFPPTRYVRPFVA